MKANKRWFGRKTAQNSAKRPTIKKTKKIGRKSGRTALFQDGLGVLSVAAFLFLGATAREVNLLLALGSIFAGFATLDYFWGRRTLRRLRVSRTAPDSIYVGDVFYVALEMTNESKRASSWALVVEDRWAPEISPFDAGELKKDVRLKNAGASSDLAPRPVVYFPKIAGGETRKERYSGVLTRRGRRRLEALTLSTRFPCGFFRSSERFEATDEILVFPKIGRLTAAWDAFAGNATQDATAPTGRTSRIPDETLTVRDWRPGDAKKTIHWRATAKRDRLQTRDFEERKSKTVVLILDLFLEKKTEKRDANEAFRVWENVELAVSFAATLTERWTRSGDAKFLFSLNGVDDSEPTSDENDGDKAGKNVKFADDSTIWNDGSGSATLRQALTRLALAAPTNRDRLSEILTAAQTRTFADAKIFVVSVAPFDFKRLNRCDATLFESAANIETAENARTSGRWDNARFIDVSSADFAAFFEPDADATQR